MFRAFRFLIWLGATLLAMGCMAAAVVGLGGGLSDRLDIPNQFAPFWLAGGVVAGAVGSLGFRGRLHWLVVGPALIAIVIGGWRTGPEVIARLTPRAKPQAAEERLKVVHFNAYFKNTSPKRSVDWILAQDADMVTVVEGEGIPRDQALRLRARYPYCNGCRGKRTPWGNMILAKRPSLAEGRFSLPRPDTRYPINGGWSRFRGAGGEITLMVVHLSWPWRPGGRQQREALAEFVRRRPTERVVLVGDFNMTPWSDALRRFDQQLGGLSRRTHGQGSWPAQAYYRLPFVQAAPLPFLAIDQAYAGQGWRTVSVKRGPRLGSDHYPIVVELAAAPKQQPRNARPARPRP